jgi:predicted nucleic acid-binding protein
MDEAAGRTAVSVENIDTRGTAFLVLRRVKEGKISAATARETIDSMIDAGWYCAPDLYADILGTLDDLS